MTFVHATAEKTFLCVAFLSIAYVNIETNVKFSNVAVVYLYTLKYTRLFWREPLINETFIILLRKIRKFNILLDFQKKIDRNDAEITNIYSLFFGINVVRT